MRDASPNLAYASEDLEEAVLQIKASARRVRQNSLTMVHHAGVGHPGGDFSSADILATLYLHVLKIDKQNPRDSSRDRFVMSKGHCSAALYATLAEVGILEKGKLAAFMDPLSALNGHPDRNKVPGVEANTGPLGHGLPIAVGCALAAKIGHEDWRTFVLTGDGELQEGSNWEAAMTAAQYGLDNLTLIVDRNRIQQGDFTENIINMESLADRWRAFNWAVTEIAGNDPRALLECFRRLPLQRGRPSCIIANTTKGRGVSFMENRPEWHHKIPSDAQLAQAIAELQEAGE